MGLGRQAELLRAGIRTLGGALAGVATVGGLAALVNRSISAADAIGKTADKIGVGVEALQELRFAAKASGVEQQTLDMALQRFVAVPPRRHKGRARPRMLWLSWVSRSATRMGICAGARTCWRTSLTPCRMRPLPSGPARLQAVRFRGLALVNLLSDGAAPLTRCGSAPALGIVLDEHLVWTPSGPAPTRPLAQVVSANLTRAALEAAPVIADLSSWLADVAGKAGIAWERLFDAPEDKSLRTLRYELDLTESTIAKLQGRIDELRKSPTLGFTTFIDTAQISALQSKIDELSRVPVRPARIAFLEGPPEQPGSHPASLRSR